MIKVVIKGGLGNQLFQYAAGYALAKKLGQLLVLDASFFPKQTLRGFKLDKLNLCSHEIQDKNTCVADLVYKNKNTNGIIRRLSFKTLPYHKGKYLIDHAGSFTPDFFSITADNIFLNGYFQSEEYFVNERQDLLRQITPNYEIENEYLQELEKIEKNESVAVHIRHGDFLKENKGYHYILSSEYYNAAIRYIKNKIPNATFFCFSDDIEWVKSNIGNSDNFNFVSLHTKYADIDELMLMRNCKHIITANSTFSWWAAWLNEHPNAIRVVPKKAYGNKHMIPSDWIKLEE